MGPLGMFGPRTGHKPLYADLCRFHEFDRPTKLLLKEILVKFQPERPADIFVDPALLRRAIVHPDFSESVDALQALYKDWFGSE